jgi:aryl-alcohol dehydrogenase-like predicted oxidoreductase
MAKIDLGSSTTEKIGKQEMLQRPLGATGITVSQVGFGSWAIGGNTGIKGYGPSEHLVAEDTVKAAFRAGITLYDTADVYGEGVAESIIGAVLEPVRHNVVLCTKGGWDLSRGAPNLVPSYLHTCVTKSLKRLRTNFIDIYLLHNPPPHLIGIRETYRPLIELRERGILGHIGVSVSCPNEALLALDVPDVEVVQVPYNMLIPDAEVQLFPLAAENGVGIIAREALGNGLLTGKYNRETRFPKDDFRSDWPTGWIEGVLQQVQIFNAYRRNGESMIDLALRFVLERPQVASVVVGARNPEQVSDHIRAGVVRPVSLPEFRSFTCHNLTKSEEK